MIWTFGVGAVMKSGLKNDDDFYGKSTFFVKTFYYWWSYMHTVWKNGQKCDHAEKFSVKSHSKKMPILPLQMDAFLPLGGFYE